MIEVNNDEFVIIAETNPEKIDNIKENVVILSTEEEKA